MNGVLIENEDDLDLVMPMYNLLDTYYSKTSGSLWNYYRDELPDETNDDNGPNKNVINSQSLLNTRQPLQEVLIMWQLLLDTMMQIKAQKKLKLLCH